MTDSAGERLGQLEVVSLALAATGGTLPAATLLAVAVARYAPLSVAARFAFGYASAIPFWVAAMHFCWLASSARRAWLWCGVASVVSSTLAFR